MWLSVLSGDLDRAATDDDAIAALVEHLRDAGLQALVVTRPVEGDTDEAGREVAGLPRKPPRDAACFVVQAGEQVPGARCFVLPAAVLFCARVSELRVPRSAANQLERVSIPHRVRLENRAEVFCRSGARLLPRTVGVSLGDRALGEVVGARDEDDVETGFFVKSGDFGEVEVCGGADGV